MRTRVIRHLVAHARPQSHAPTILQLRDQRPLENQEHVPTTTPVIRLVSGAVLDEADSNIALLERPPQRRAGRARVLGRGNLAPVDRGEWHIPYLHRASRPPSSTTPRCATKVRRTPNAMRRHAATRFIPRGSTGSLRSA